MSGRPLMHLIARLLLSIICIASCLALPLTAAESAARGWLVWRGPQQDGTSAETGLPDQVDSSAPLWSMDLPGRGTPVINGNKVYVLARGGVGPCIRARGRLCTYARTSLKPFVKE